MTKEKNASKKNHWIDRCFSNQGSVTLLLLATLALLTFMLGGRELWTQEHRWADIVYGMIYRHDYLHPSLGNVEYYDKPLLSYWLIILITKLTGQLSELTIRLPSALSALLAIWSLYRIGLQLISRQVGLMAGWLLLTTFYFIFWGRIASTDMLNLAGTLFAICWYFEKKHQPTFFNYVIFFLILAISSLCKGLLGAIVPCIAVFPDLCVKGEWRKHLRFSLLLSPLPAVIVYLLPFLISSFVASPQYHENGLMLVFRENVLRYFSPFDHQGPIYTYLIYLPLYLLPWTPFFLPTLFQLKTRWSHLTWPVKWMAWALLLVFIFFTMSGSRRSYYVLPILPFAVLITAEWIVAQGEKALRFRLASRAVIFFYGILFSYFVVFQPLFYGDGGIRSFVAVLHQTETRVNPSLHWRYVLLDPKGNMRFYLRVPPDMKIFDVQGDRESQTKESLLKAWPFLLKQTHDTIYISRQQYLPLLKVLLPQYIVVVTPKNLGNRFLHIEDLSTPIALIPYFSSQKNKI